MTFKILLAFFGIILSTTLLTILTAIDFQKNNILSVGKNHINGRFHMMARGDTAMVNQNELVVFDFAKTSDREQWRPINDTVMGGISKSRLQLTKDENALFTGNVSLENSGGFASLQSKPSNYDFSGYEGIRIRVKGDGKRYKFSMKNNTFLDSPRYQAAFNTESGVWTTIRIPFYTMVPTFRGTVLTNESIVDITKVKSFGLLISDKQEGPFRLEINWIKAYRSDS